MASSHRSSDSYSGSTSNLAKESRSSIDSERSIDVELPSNYQNGTLKQHNGSDLAEDSDNPIDRLKAELSRTQEEKEKLATQYRNLLTKLTQMRTTLGNKLQQDAVSEMLLLCLSN